MPSLAATTDRLPSHSLMVFSYHSALHLVERLNLFQGLLSFRLVSAVNIFCKIFRHQTESRLSRWRAEVRGCCRTWQTGKFFLSLFQKAEIHLLYKSPY